MFGFRVLILATCLSWSYCKLDKYCAICEDHTMCKFHGIGKDCVDVGGAGVTEDEKVEIVSLHNWLRRIVAGGHETKGSGGSQPKAANMRELIWDEELSSVAQRWADQCRFEHDSCRHDPRWRVGQNIYWKFKYPTHHVNWTEAILSWYNEVSEYNPNEVEAYRFEPSTGHYTQMLWHETFAVGCGRRDYGSNKIYICNYGPAGNWIGEAMYEKGDPCTKCPHGTVCNEFLCGLPSKRLQEVPIEIRIDANALQSPPETNGSLGNETEHLEVLTPPKENAKTVYASEPSQIADEPAPTSAVVGTEQTENLYDILLSVEDTSSNKNTVDDNELDLDADTRQEIEQIKFQIEQLVKNVTKKLRTKR